jgi:hypothetical protein
MAEGPQSSRIAILSVTGQVCLKETGQRLCRAVSDYLGHQAGVEARIASVDKAAY